MPSQSTRPLKKVRRAKQGNLLTRPLAESSADMFFFLYDDDLAELMFKFASIKCLCKLDILCKRSQRTTPSRWAERTMSRLGLAGGKRDWRHYHVLLGGPTFFRLQDDGDFGFGDMLAGSPDVTSNGNIVVGVSDDVEHNCCDRKFPGETQAIALRDAFSLNFVKLLSSPINNWKVAICGRVGSEIIVTSNFQQIAAQRGQDVQLPNVTGEMGGNTHGIPMLGCETHLLALAGNRLLLFAVGTSDKLLIPRQNIRVHDNYDPAEDSPSAFAWNDNQTQFAFAFPRSSQIQIWRLDVEQSKAIHTTTLGVADGLSIAYVAISDDFVVASCQLKKIHIWDRRTGTKMHTLCDVNEDEQLDPAEIIYPLCMKIYGGSFLVSASHLGHALCIWNMRTGELMRKYRNAEDEREVDMLPDGLDVTSMTYVAPLNAFICMSGYMMVWAFPITKRQISMIKSIKRRERWISRAVFAR